ncbi:YceK/YidQ family lipoprotein [Vibrio coralliilyticus]|uniref:YceK/YidQ family lipoprotein n=1 Tax=Vibrio coralliilyticus TaxID=190893 RepID=UPI000B3098C4|nr:YceK/YidQ family lipoprotein [Vibrio coralliilyticus]
MALRKRLKLLGIALISLIQGCSSVDTHIVSGELGHPFSGTVQSAVYQPCVFILSGNLFFIPYPIAFVDLPLSLAADLLFLPVDLALMSSTKGGYSSVIDYPSGCT